MRLRCPICRREVSWEGNPHRPFCSERCQAVDLGAWVTERYRIPGEPATDESGGRQAGEDENPEE